MDYPLSHRLRKREDTTAERSPVQYHSRYLACYQRLSSVQVELRKTEALFNKPQVWPDQCREAIRFITGVENASRGFTELLTDALDLPEGIKHRRYAILLHSGYLTAECRKLLPLIRDIPGLKINSKRRKETNDKVLYLLRSVRLSLKDLIEEMQVEQVNPLLDAIRPQ